LGSGGASDETDGEPLAVQVEPPIDLGIVHLARRVLEVELDQRLNVNRECAVLQEEREQHAASCSPNAAQW
jgi:hypothetical protein